VRERTLDLEGAMVPTLYRSVNICRSGIGSGMESRKGSQQRLWQNSTHKDQDMLVLPAVPTEMALVAAALIAPNSWKRLCFPVGSQASRVAEWAIVVVVVVPDHHQKGQKNGKGNRQLC
jgi:hypothetical protein